MHCQIQLQVNTRPIQLLRNTAPTLIAQVRGGPAGADLNILTTLGDILSHDGVSPDRLPVGTDGQQLTADSGAGLGVSWQDPVTGALTTVGDLLGFNGATTRFPVGADDAVLVADSGQAFGFRWGSLPLASLPLHASTHENGGADEINVAGLSGLLADAQTPLAHAPSHLPSGTDPLTTAIANTILPDDAPAIGVAESFARSDHRHGIAAAIAAALLVGQVGSEGVSTSFSRADHGHAVAAAVPSATVNAGDLSVEGVATTFVRSDHQHAVATAVAVTIDANTANAEGVSTSLARADHTHDIPSAVPSATVNAGDAAVEGVAAGLSRTDHQHAVATATAVTIDADTANAEGVSTSLARADHTHDIPTAVVVDVGAANAEGVSASLARADHVHNHGNLLGGSLHAVATIALAGFMSAADKTTFDAHLNPIDTTNPHLVTLTQAYVAGGGTTTLNTTQNEFEIDGAALAAGSAGTAGPDYFAIIRGAVNVLNTAYNATDLRTTIYSTAINGIDLSPDPGVFPNEPIITLTRNHLEFLRTDRTFSATGFQNLFALTSQITLDFNLATMGAFVLFGPTIRYADTVNGFGMGLLFNASGIFENDPASAINLTTGLSYVGQNTYRANAQTITMLQQLDFLSQPRLNITAGGTFTMTGNLRHFTARGTLATGATLTGDRQCFLADALSTFTGTMTGANVGFDVSNLVSGTGGAYGLRTAITVGAGRFSIDTGTALARFGGEVEIDGTLNHDGTLAGFRGSAPVALSAAYTVNNPAVRRTIDVAGATLTELLEFVGTMIADLQPQGLLG